MMRALMRFFGRVLLIAAMLLAPTAPVSADLRSAPTWYDQNAVTTAPDWHYRVPINVPAGASVNSTIKVDVDFTALLSQMGVTGTFDVNSPRVIRSTGALSTNQEFTDAVYNGATDTTGNGRGEVRFILEDAGAVTYYLYFDITQNGAKPANPQVPINGNFERGATGTTAPLGWNAPTMGVASYDAQVRPSETYTTSTSPSPVDTPTTRTTDGTPNTGAFSYLIGQRTVGGAAAGSGVASGVIYTGTPGATITKTITVPASNPGSITFRYRPEGWDTGDYDPIAVDLTNTGGTLLVEMVGPNTGSYGTKPFGPNTNNAQATTTVSGYRQYNGFDCNLAGGHTLAPPMTTPCHSEPWFTVTQSLAAYVGQTIQFRVRVWSDAQDKSWYSLDDVEWSVVTATLGTPQAFGVNITLPAPAGSYVPGQAMPITVQVDAIPANGTTPMTASIYDPSGALVAGPFTLYNDGTHGDVTAGDAVWSNNNSVPANPSPTIPLTAPTATNYVLRVFGRDAATSGGLAQIPGAAAAQTQADFWNIDEILFNVTASNLSVAKTNTIISDPVNGATNPKYIPGARVQYCITITNIGTLAATSIVGNDTLPPETTYQAGTVKTGATCATAATANPANVTFIGTTLTITNASLAAGASMAVTFEALVN